MKKLLLLLFILFLIPFANAQDIKLNGTISAENNQIKNVSDPTEAQDAVTKAYIDALIATLQSQIDDLHPNSGYISYGDQVWTVKNAKMVTYRDGTPIPKVNNYQTWQNLTTGAWCYYNNDITKGKLYNWYAVMGIHDTNPNTPNKEFAPEGWHVPSDAEWTTLEEYLIANGYNYDDATTGNTTTGNNIAKAMASTTGWNSSTAAGAPGNATSLNNSSNFNAFPEGYRDEYGNFNYEGSEAFFWSSDEDDFYEARFRYLFFSYSGLGRNHYYKQYGFSVRFVRD